MPLRQPAILILMSHLRSSSFLASIATDSVPFLGKKLIMFGLKVVYLD
jgi:hypothetical protein